MTDLRARLAEALQRSPFRAGLYIPIDAVPDLLLSLPGIASVELPEKVDGPGEWTGPVWVSRAGNVRMGTSQWSPGRARELAAALLAAANAAESVANG